MGLYSKDEVTGSFMGLGIIASVALIFCGIMAIWTDRNLDFWLTHLKGKEIDVPYWLSLVLTIVGNAVIMLANVIGEIMRFFV